MTEELRPKPRRGRQPADPEAKKAELEQKGEYVDPKRQEEEWVDVDYAGPMEEPPVAIDDPGYLAVLEAAVEAFGEDMTPESREALSEEIVTTEGRLRQMRDQTTLIQKLVEVASEIDAIEKKGYNQNQSYAYQKAVDVTRVVRDKLYERGVLMTTSIRDVRYELIERVGRTPNVLVTLTCAFRLTDGREVLEFEGAGMGIDAGDKGLYKAITGALKYGLRTLFLIPDERDDPEVPRPDEAPGYGGGPIGPINITPAEVSGVSQGGRQNMATSAQIAKIRERARDLSMSALTLKALIVSQLGHGPEGDTPDEVLDFLAKLSFAECGKIAKALVEAEPNESDE